MSDQHEQPDPPADPLDLSGEQEPQIEPDIVEDDLADMAIRCQELEARLLRAHADYQNYVRRAQLNAEHARQQQLTEVARDLLTVLDHFDHALEVDPRKSTAASLLEGLTIVRDELMRTLERYGIKRLTVSPGDEFDPNRHEALMRQKVEGVPSNHIAAQLQPGYLLGDRTLRPAKVSVAE